MLEQNEIKILDAIPIGLRNDLLKSFDKINRNYIEERWEPSELNGGKFCEAVYSILQGYVDGSFPQRATKPNNMVVSCRNLEQTPSTFPRSIRIQIPRMIIALYEIRNNRGVGHIGGDVDPNLMDATAVLYMSKWILSEMIRVFHNLDTISASKVVELVIDRTIPIVWHVGDLKRILKTNLNMKEKSLLILYQNINSVSESYLVDCVEHSNLSVYRRDILRKLHKEKLIEYDKINKTALISPIGKRFVEQNIDLNL